MIIVLLTFVKFYKIEFSKSSDLGQKLRDQVNLTKELDTRLITDSIKLNEKLRVGFNNNKKNNNTNDSSKQLPENIKVKLEEMFFSILKQHKQKKIQKNLRSLLFKIEFVKQNRKRRSSPAFLVGDIASEVTFR